ERRALIAEEGAGAGEGEGLFDVCVGGGGAAVNGENAAGAIHNDDGHARAVGGEGGDGDEGLHFGGGELDIAGRVDGDRGGVALGHGDLDEAACGIGRKRELSGVPVERDGGGGD